MAAARRVAVVGGGPGGLFFAALLKQADPVVDITVFERNHPDDTFGFGVVFSDATLSGLNGADPVLLRALNEHGRRWDQIEIRLKGERRSCGGNGMSAVVRKTLLMLLRKRAADVGVELRYGTDVGSAADIADFDVIVGADGANSRIRQEREHEFGPRVETATAKFIWFGTTYQFDGLTFLYDRDEHGTFAVHGYPIGDGLSTFIVETDEDTWRAAGLDEFDIGRPPGASDLKSQEYLEKLFAEQIDGHRWCATTHGGPTFGPCAHDPGMPENTVILGDAAHTAHFSVGSGTKMAMEDAAALAATLVAHSDDVPTAFEAYEARGARRWSEYKTRHAPACRGGKTSAGTLMRSSRRNLRSISCPAASAARSWPGVTRISWPRSNGTGRKSTAPPCSKRRSRLAGTIFPGAW